MTTWNRREWIRVVGLTTAGVAALGNQVSGRDPPP